MTVAVSTQTGSLIRKPSLVALVCACHEARAWFQLLFRDRQRITTATAGIPAPEPPQLVPRVAARWDRTLPIVVASSLLLHATVLLPLMMRADSAPAPQREIPVELVRLAPKPTEKDETRPRPAPPKQEPQPPKKVVRPKPAARTPPPRPVKSVAERLKDLIGPMPALALPGTTAAGADAVSYSQLVLSKLAKSKKEGRYRGIPGAAGVAFKLGDSGEVVSVEIVRPSGDPVLDAEAIAMVRRGAPYPPPPPGGRRDYAITLRFSAI